ncbi:hypothetical protein E1281_00910 [Actinomadura sp. KC345]|uniref:hypothetical protein n=1 Tax=Actinomadura sp. KC345 TaxID=2530371 RepID=UPI00104400B9|nr:hypothetical protein [Actinomadura sp. KC345]TDC58543.1 hypothetical protein E1281_00910 [Actinomadura sp. KC345]
MKRISRFLPTALRPRDEADEHYVMVHHRFAMRMFREHAPTVTRYATNHATAQYDLASTFRRRPADAWRFIMLEFGDPAVAAGAGHDGDAGGPSVGRGGKEWLPTWAEHAIVSDHTNFLREVRPFEVTPSVAVDRRSGQTSLVKYLIEIEDTGAGSDAGVFESVRSALAEAAPDAFGLRLHIANDVVREAEMAAVSEPGQAYTGRYRERTGMYAIDEMYFDHAVWAEEFFASLAMRPALAPRTGVRVAVYAVTELVGVDRS